MIRCTRCLYPDNTKPTILFDDDGVCSGCNYSLQRDKRTTGEWCDSLDEFHGLLFYESYKQGAKGNPYDCIIPVSGGKDSFFQVKTVVEMGLNPLLVTFNHAFNSELGLVNLRHLVDVSGCDLVRYTLSTKSAQKIARWATLEMGDVTFAYHAGIMCIPMRAAVQWDVPLVVWGEEGFSEMMGMFQFEDKVEYTRWKTLEHDQRGYDREHLIGQGEGQWEITAKDVEFMRYPSEAEIERVGVRGIYMSSYLPWDARAHAEEVVADWGFKMLKQRERTLLAYSKIDDWANDVHDYMKYLKFGYGRATDDMSSEIRVGRMDRVLGLEVAEHLDRVKPIAWQPLMTWLQLTDQIVLEALQQKAEGGNGVVEDRWQAAQWETTYSIHPDRYRGLIDKGPLGLLLDDNVPFYVERAGRGAPAHKYKGLPWVTL